VLYYAHRGSLKTYLEQHYGQLDWVHKLGILYQVAEGLSKIHQAGFVHRDFHSGNILQSKNAEIADLGFTGPANKVTSVGKKNVVYGVLPYIAPEVLRGEKYTHSSDIYSFGIVMWEVATCLLPFGDRAHDTLLALDVCRGHRPEIGEYNIPVPFVKLMKSCWNAKPRERPHAHDVYQTLHRWYFQLKDGHEDAITMAFKNADKSDSMFPTPASSRHVTVTHPLAVYTSRLLDFPNLPEPVNSPPQTPWRRISVTSILFEIYYYCYYYYHYY